MQGHIVHLKTFRTGLGSTQFYWHGTTPASFYSTCTLFNALNSVSTSSDWTKFIFLLNYCCQLFLDVPCGAALQRNVVALCNLQIYINFPKSIFFSFLSGTLVSLATTHFEAVLLCNYCILLILTQYSSFITSYVPAQCRIWDVLTIELRFLGICEEHYVVISSKMEKYSIHKFGSSTCVH